jgi:predicted MFS family arabinose efflux permease
LVFTAFGIAGVVGPMLGAKINDHYASYLWAYRISAVMLVLGAALAVFTHPPAAQAVQAEPQPGLSSATNPSTLKPKTIP